MFAVKMTTRPRSQIPSRMLMNKKLVPTGVNGASEASRHPEKQPKLVSPFCSGSKSGISSTLEGQANSNTSERFIKSKQRVADYGEVLTPPHIVNAMLDLVKQETERIDARFLEPACGTGNFLVEVLKRKLSVVEKRYRKSQLDYERYAVLATSSIYGIDILEDNAEECRQRLFQTFDAAYTALFDEKTKPACFESVRFILKRNILQGDALSLQTVGDNPKPIVFSEWSMLNRSYFKRRDFAFHELLRTKESPQNLFEAKHVLVSDKGERVFIPEPVREYPMVHFLEIARAYDHEL